MLNRLAIRQKLALLLLIPLAAVVLVLVPFTAERIQEARSAGTTAATASAARQIGGLLESLQQERLLTAGYLSVPTLDRSTLVAQTQTAVDTQAQLRSDPSTASVLVAAAPALAALAAVRPAVINRTIDALGAYQAFRTADRAILDALHLADPPGADAAGLTQLNALDALMRSNEEASSVGAALVAVAADPALNRRVLTDAVAAGQQDLDRFRQLVPTEQSSLVDTVDSGKAGQRINQIVGKFSQPGAPASVADVSDALTAAVGYTDLRRFAQDRVAREVATDAQSRAGAAGTDAYLVAGGAVVIVIAVIWLGLAVSRSIARPLRRLTRAAIVVAELSANELVRVSDSESDDLPAPQLAAVEVDSTDEIGELAQALNQVQATAAALLERQVTARRNVSVMFANIARRTQSLVGRQLSLIDELERDERNPELQQRLYRLDHVATRLRRSADSLLVVSGTVEQLMSGAPTRLADVLRSALSEIEGYEAVDIAPVPAIALSSSVVTDLRLLLAELLENATHFSPPGARVSLSASIEGDCRIAVVDHGLGIGPARLDEENRRLLERERLDVAPSNVLGLFVVGRLARRHGLSVRLEQTAGRGVTATVWIPNRLLTEPAASGRGVLATRVRPLPARHRADAPRTAPALFELDFEPGEPFGWFARQFETPAPASSRARTPATAAATALSTGAGLAKRNPGTHMIADAALTAPVTAKHTERARRDPEAERDRLNDYLAGFSKGTEHSGGPARVSAEELA